MWKCVWRLTLLTLAMWSMRLTIKAAAMKEENCFFINLWEFIWTILVAVLRSWLNSTLLLLHYLISLSHLHHVIENLSFFLLISWSATDVRICIKNAESSIINEIHWSSRIFSFPLLILSFFAVLISSSRRFFLIRIRNQLICLYSNMIFLITSFDDNDHDDGNVW